MKAIVCEEPNVFVQREVEPPVPEPGMAIVKIRRVGVCGTDIHAFRGSQPFFTYPRILGHELSGEIVHLQESPDGLKTGDLVTILPYFACGGCVACKNQKPNCCTNVSVFGVHADGGMREYVSIPTKYVVKADGLGLDELAIVECLSIGAHAVRRANVLYGENILVIGAGPIGLGVMKFAKLNGARVIALDINKNRLDFCKGWAHVDDCVLVGDNAVENVRELTVGEFPTAVFDATGNAKSMMSAINYLAHGGRLVYVGLVQADITFHDPEFHKRETTMMASRNATIEDFQYVIECLKTHRIDANTFITHRGKFDDVVDTFEKWTKPESNVIKAMIEV